MSRSTNKTLYFLLGTAHIVLMGLFFISGFILPLSGVVLIYILIELSLIIFNGCFITSMQRRVGALKVNEDFIPFLIFKFFGLRINQLSHQLISYAIMVFPLVVALIRSQ
jgi:hypothetical protein